MPKAAWQKQHRLWQRTIFFLLLSSEGFLIKILSSKNPVFLYKDAMFQNFISSYFKIHYHKQSISKPSAVFSYPLCQIQQIAFFLHHLFYAVILKMQWTIFWYKSLQSIAMALCILLKIYFKKLFLKSVSCPCPFAYI